MPAVCPGSDLAGDGGGEGAGSLCKVTCKAEWETDRGEGEARGGRKKGYLINYDKATGIQNSENEGGRGREGPQSSRTMLKILAFTLRATVSH